jgi:hypothetical protein
MPFQVQEKVTLASGISRICRMLSLPVPADPAGDTDPNVQQIVVAMNSVAAELYSVREWQELVISFDLSVVADSAGQQEKAFDLPEDWGRFVDQTQWSPSQQWPAVGPISPQGWMSYLVRDFAPGLSLFWQVRNDKIWFLSPPYPTPADFKAFYVTRGYVQDQDDPTMLKDIATKNGDKFLLDGTLMVLGGRLKWLEYKGFDTSTAARDFQIQYDSRAGTERGAPVLDIARLTGVPMIGIGNIPDTGYGA